MAVSRRKITEKDEAVIRNALREGMIPAAITKTYGYTYSTIKRVRGTGALKKAGNVRHETVTVDVGQHSPTGELTISGSAAAMVSFFRGVSQ